MCFVGNVGDTPYRLPNFCKNMGFTEWAVNPMRNILENRGSELQDAITNVLLSEFMKAAAYIIIIFRVI